MVKKRSYLISQTLIMLFYNDPLQEKKFVEIVRFVQAGISHKLRHKIAESVVESKNGAVMLGKTRGFLCYPATFVMCR